MIRTTPPAPALPGPSAKGSWHSWYVVGLLLAAYTLSYVDRQILTLMVDPISRDLGLTDTQFSLLHGLAFAILYTFLGMPFGWLADRWDRRMIAAAGVAGWSAMTMLCSISRNYWQLFLARTGVGVGEAALSPAAYSMIADLFPRERLARANSIYSMGIAAGAGLALIFGGYVIQLANTMSHVALPVVGTLRAWQIVFVLLGLVGLPLTLLLLCLKEPARRDASNEPIAVRQVMAFLASRKRMFSCFLIGLSCASALGNGMLGWVPSHFIRVHQWSAAEVGLRYGLCVLLIGGAGMIVGARLTEILQGRGIVDAPLRVAAAAIGLCAPIGIVAPLASNSYLALALFALLQFFYMMPWGIAGAIIQLVSPNRMRGLLSAFYLFCVNIVGLTLGPTLVAALTDHMYGGGAGVAFSLATAAALLAPLAAGLLAMGFRAYRDAIDLALPEPSSPTPTAPQLRVSAELVQS